jgi:hypothetical protein
MVLDGSSSPRTGGPVEPSRLELFVLALHGPGARRLLSLEGVKDPAVFWWHRALVVACRHGDRNVVVTVDPSTGLTRTIFTEDNRLPGRSPIDPFALAVWPDSSLLAFSRLYEDAELGPTIGDGVWLLNLRTGECIQVTREESGHYWHEVVRWENAARLLFVRRTQAGTWDVYRATIR